MTTIQDLTSVLKKLRRSGALETMELRERQASDDNLSNRDFLFRVLNDEVERREAKQLHLRLRRAAFDCQRTIEDFDFAYNPQILKSKVVDLAIETGQPARRFTGGTTVLASAVRCPCTAPACSGSRPRADWAGTGALD